MSSISPTICDIFDRDKTNNDFMVSTNYVKELLKYMKVSQKDLAEEWGKLSESDRGKKQSMISKAFREKKYIESASMIQAVSNLTKVPVTDIWNEIAFNRDDNSLIFTVNEPEGEYHLSPNNYSVPVLGHENAAKLLLGMNQESQTADVRSVGRISLPRTMLSEGIHVCEPHKGHRMAGSIEDGEYAIYKLMSEEDWDLMITDYIYLVLSHDGERFLGRVKNRLDQHGLIVLYPDNKDDQYKDYVVRREDIHQVWKLVSKIGYQFPNPNSRIIDKFEQVDDDVTGIKLQMDKLMDEIRKLKA